MNIKKYIRFLLLVIIIVLVDFLRLLQLWDFQTDIVAFMMLLLPIVFATDYIKVSRKKELMGIGVVSVIPMLIRIYTGDIDVVLIYCIANMVTLSMMKISRQYKWYIYIPHLLTIVCTLFFFVLKRWDMHVDMMAVIREICYEAEVIRGSEISQKMIEGIYSFSYIRRTYLLTWFISTFGWISISFVAIIIFYLVWSCWKRRKCENEMLYIAGGIVITLQSVIYLLANIGVLPVSVYPLPFMTDSILSLLVNGGILIVLCVRRKVH